MTREDLLALYKEFYVATMYCNEQYAAMGEPGLATEELPDKFTYDFVPLVFYAVCADDVVTPVELERANGILQHLGVVVDEEQAEGAKELVKKDHFHIPATLVVFTLRACMRLDAAKEDERDAVLNEELEFLDSILMAYADTMHAVVEKVTAAEQLMMATVLNTCRAYISDELGVEFALNAELKKLIGEE